MEAEIGKTPQEATATGRLIPVYVMGRRYEVPEGLTIMKAMEYAGFQFIRGCGCRAGICGACATVYRKGADYHLRVGLACQTVVEPEMYLTQLPFYPANRSTYDFAKLTGTPEEIFQLYPEIFRCLACNACTKACPMEVQMMDVISALKQGDIARTAILSFDCIQCGLCASRCLGELPQYHIAQLARRLYGSRLLPRAQHLVEAARAVVRHGECLERLMRLDEAELRETYQDRELEPEMAGEDWMPSDTRFL